LLEFFLCLVHRYSLPWNIPSLYHLSLLFARKKLLHPFYLIGTGQAPNEDYMTTIIDSFRKYIGCFRAGGNQEGGYVFGYGTDKPGDVAGSPAMGKAFEMGKTI
jgi:hypothetical protein